LEEEKKMEKKVRWLSLSMSSLAMETAAKIAETTRQYDCEVLLNGIDAKDPLALLDGDIRDDVDLVLVGECDDVLDHVYEALQLNMAS
jgi:hypothetical protein